MTKNGEIVISKNGIKYYRYYKKKRGRHKKPGPHRKPKKRGRSWQQTWDFKIVQCDFKKQKKVIGIFHNAEEAYKVKKILEERNDNIDIPICYYTGKNYNKRVTDFESEYLILERVRDEKPDTMTSMFRNEFGKLVPYTTTSLTWRIFDKFPCKQEEKFWILGLGPHNNRKPYKWIKENLFTNFIESDKDLFLRIFLYYNKIIIRYDIEGLNMIICKNQNDAIRVYNKLSEDFQKEKRTIFIGNVINKSELGQSIIQLIQENTGWDKDKIIRTTTY